MGNNFFFYKFDVYELTWSLIIIIIIQEKEGKRRHKSGIVVEIKVQPLQSV